MMTPHENGVPSIAVLSEVKVDVKAAFTYSFLEALFNTTFGTNTNSRRAANAKIYLY